MPRDTRTLLGPGAAKCDSRSLYLDRFADPGAKDSGDLHPRRDWFNTLHGKTAPSSATGGGREWLTQVAANGRGGIIFAQLQSRLLVNMVGGVMENAGLCLDRFGLPFIPGSAVKGCARRMAIQDLLERSQSNRSSEELATLLNDIALVFGWGNSDWKPGRQRRRQRGEWIETEPFSDFWWALADDSGGRSADSQRHSRWPEVAEKAAAKLFKKLHAKPRELDKLLAPQLPSFAGSLSFLPAYSIKTGANALPLAEPELGALELDVVTCHHCDYYASDDPSERAEDTEEPVPVVFPTIAAGHVFIFAMLPLRDSSRELLSQARTWLSGGLGTFGLGAKTGAGYGWFDTGDKVQTVVLGSLQRASVKPSHVLLGEFLKWDDRQLRKAAAAFAFAALVPKAGREATIEYRLTLAKFILENRTALFLREKNHAGSDFARGVKRLAQEFQILLP
jgi:CRISPR type III-B/RAMP module RAMP protein Cmr6